VRLLVYIFAYVFVPVIVCTCVRIGCAPQLRCCSLLRRRRPRPSLPAALTCFHLFATVWGEIRDRRCVQTGGSISDFFQVRRCWIKIDSVVNLGETPSSEFVQCVLWVIWLTKTVESICCAIHHTVTLPRAVWRTIRSPHHSVRVLIATTTDAAVTDRPPTVLRRQQFVLSMSFTTQLLQRVCCSALAASS